MMMETMALADSKLGVHAQKVVCCLIVFCMRCLSHVCTRVIRLGL